MTPDHRPTRNLRQKDILKHLFVYLGSAWVVIEALNFLIDKYYWNSGVLDILILVIIFGLPAMVIFLWFDRRFTRKAFILHSVNLAIMVSVIGISLARPGSLDPNQIRLFKFKEDQRKLAEKVRALAVLPFSNYTGDDSNKTVILGMHDALINELGRISAIRVISKTSTLPYARTGKSVKEIASDLNVDALIEASVLNVDGGINITVKMINATPEQQLWSRTFESDKENFLGLYSRIVKEIASQINIALSPGEVSYIESDRIVDPEAHKAYLQGMYYVETLTERGFNLAVENFNRSMALDSLYAPAYAGKAFAWMAAVQMRYVTVAEGIPKIYSNNLKALTLDPDYPEGQYINALMSMQGEWNWEKSSAAFKKSIASNPNHALSHAYYGHLLMFRRRFDEAIKELETAISLDPYNGLVYGLYSVVLWHYGDLEGAMEMSAKADELNPLGNKNGLRRVQESASFMDGDLDRSMELLEFLYGDIISDFGRVASTYETKDYQSAMIELAEQLKEQSHLQSLIIAWFYNRAGMEKETIDWLERGYEMHDPDMPYAFLPLEFRNLISNSRYQALAEKMKLPLPGPS